MATIIKLKRNETLGDVPSGGDLATGEVAINSASKAMYVKDSGGNIVQVASNDVDEATALAIALG
mgnify:CR=1 FL=1